MTLTVLPPTAPSPAALDELAHGIASLGIEIHEPEVAAVADEAARRGACAVLVAVVTDQDAPRVARERAFGRLAAQLAARLTAEAAEAVASVPAAGSPAPWDVPDRLCA